MDKAQWILDYEAAFLAANGKPCRVVLRGAGWYGIEDEEAGPISTYRRAKIVEMTANLERRIQETSPTP